MKFNKIFFLAIIFGSFSIITGKVSAKDTASILFETQTSAITVGQSVKVNVFINSSVPVNAAQLSITYPQSEFSLLSIDSSSSTFSIKAMEKASPGIIEIARGNIKALQGKRLFTVLNLKPLRSSASISQLGYLSTKSLVMSEANVNILSGSQVQTVKPEAPTSATTSNTNNSNIKINRSGFIKVVTQAVKQFFHDLFH